MMPAQLADLSDLEASFLFHFKVLAEPEGLPEPESQYKYFNYILDFAFPDLKLAIELDGGRGGGYGRVVKCHACGATVRAIRKGGGVGKPLRLPYPSHSGQGAERDLEKQNLLIMGGWSILRFSSAMIEDKPEICIDMVVRLYRRLRKNK